MEEKSITITTAEWKVMECLWEHAPCTGRELTEELEKKCKWSRSTTLALLGRLQDKRVVGAEKDGRLNAYVHLVSWEEAAFLEAKDLLSRAFQGRLSLMIRTFAKKSSLSREELDELYAILKQLDVDEDA